MCCVNSLRTMGGPSPKRQGGRPVFVAGQDTTRPVGWVAGDLHDHRSPKLLILIPNKVKSVEELNESSS